MQEQAGNRFYLDERTRGRVRGAIKGSGAHADVRIEGPGSFIRFDFTLTRGRCVDESHAVGRDV